MPARWTRAVNSVWPLATQSAITYEFRPSVAPVPEYLQVPDTWPEIRYGPEDATETITAEQILELVLGLNEDTPAHLLERIPDRGPALQRTGKASGAPVALDAAHILTLERGKAVRLVGYQSWEEAAAAAEKTDAD